MRIVAIHTEHDGAVALTKDGQLTACIEAQKDNGGRHGHLSKERLADALDYLDAEPDVIATGGWHGRGCGYFGVHPQLSTRALEAPPGADCHARRFQTTHERAHLFCAYGMSPFEQGEPCYALVWEGEIGSFYSIDEKCNVQHIATPLSQPGHRYAFLYELAHDCFEDDACGWSQSSAGKLMALAMQSGQTELTPGNDAVLRHLLKGFDSSKSRKQDWRTSPVWNCGHEDPRFRYLAYRLQDEMFQEFHSAAQKLLVRGRPLLIAGGCGLNCNWNTRWKECGLFRDVFVPPCADDSGCAIGVAVDAQRHFTGSAKLQWDVYSGEPFVLDMPVPSEFAALPLDYGAVAQILANGGVVAWVQGRYEIGPRALGNRSLLAAPFHAEMRDRLNRIKCREPYRPVAPVCREEEVSRWFEWHGESPYMLHFHQVRSSRLGAVRHEDGTARAQTVSREQNGALYDLLTAFSDQTGVGVLCNTSLNFPGHGFINRMSDLVRYASERGLDAIVVQDQLFVRRRGAFPLPAELATANC